MSPGAFLVSQRGNKAAKNEPKGIKKGHEGTYRWVKGDKQGPLGEINNKKIWNQHVARNCSIF